MLVLKSATKSNCVKAYYNLSKFNIIYNINEYQDLRNTITWLKHNLKYGQNLIDSKNDQRIVDLIVGNPQPSLVPTKQGRFRD